MCKKEDILSRIAISFLPGMKAEVARNIAAAGFSPEEFVSVALSDGNVIGEIGSALKQMMAEMPNALKKAETEYKFVEEHGIRVYSLFDDDYPWLLREVPDAPVVLYQIGKLDLNSDHVIAMVGTRRCTAYGTNFCKQVVADLASEIPDLKVISGLAYGIDAASHIAALENNVPTAAVVAHGLDMIYPSTHRDLARRIIKAGGAILTEYPSNSTPYAGRFLERNRIVAGLSHLTFVIESEVKGGAMSTANTAQSYNREVAALPGRASDNASGGCNHLIRKNKASLVASAKDIMDLMNWKSPYEKLEVSQDVLFPELEGDAYEIYEFLKLSADPATVDSIHAATSIPVSRLMSILTEMEFDGIIIRQPGNRFSPA